MSKISIEQQIAELTIEQKNNMGKIYKKYLISIISIFLLGILAGVGIFAEASIKAERAKEEWDRLEAISDFNEANNIYDSSLSRKTIDAIDEYYDAEQEKSGGIAAGSAVSLLGVLLTFAVFKKKYPYFSEKKYEYLKKMQKNSNQ